LLCKALGAVKGAALLLSVVVSFLELSGSAPAAAHRALPHPLVVLLLLWETIGLTAFTDPELVCWCELERPVLMMWLIHD